MNPFSVKTPETLQPSDIASLFIDVFSDFPKLLTAEHTFLHGARGTGKSMMLRYLEPQVQIAANNVSKASELTHYAVHMPIKNANYSLSELERLEGAPYWLLSEHFLIINACIEITSSLSTIEEQTDFEDEYKQDFYAQFLDLMEEAGSKVARESKIESADSVSKAIDKILKSERSKSKSYMSRLAFSPGFLPYEDALLGHEDFLLPFVKLVRNLPITPDGPIYLMIDDADNLPLRMQKIINGWVYYRSTNNLCMKVSTQQKYKTWRTPQGVRIESAHDYSEIDISSVYTSKSSSLYYERVFKIVQRRLDVSGASCSDPLKFFPKSESQELALKAIKEDISNSWEKGKGVSSRKSDDITRYASSEYMKSLAKSKKTNNYSYAGFKNLVDISSGMIRCFLEPAARMYAEIQATNDGKPIGSIPPEIQDKILYRWSEEYVLEEFERLRKDEIEQSSGDRSLPENKVESLKKLINSIGECFQKRLLSNSTERRLLSFMVTKTPDPQTQKILDLAIEWGYLSRKSIAKKEGVGRNTLYTLNRRLAPYFKLDPSGYAAHMSLTPEALRLATENPNAFVRDRLGSDTESNSDDHIQTSLKF